MRVCKGRGLPSNPGRWIPESHSGLCKRTATIASTSIHRPHLECRPQYSAPGDIHRPRLDFRAGHMITLPNPVEEKVALTNVETRSYAGSVCLHLVPRCNSLLRATNSRVDQRHGHRHLRRGTAERHG